MKKDEGGRLDIKSRMGGGSDRNQLFGGRLDICQCFKYKTDIYIDKSFRSLEL